MRRALGKGLSQLIADQDDGATIELNLSAIVPNRAQPREHFASESLEDLAQSIREFGVIQPLVVRPMSDGKYELIAGERRLRASKLAGLKSVPVVVRSASNQNALELALIENVQREDISPLECARAYRRLHEEFGLTQDRIADRVGKSRVAVANTIRLLKLPEEVLQGLQAGTISEGHGRAILQAGSQAEQIALFRRVVQRNLTVRQTEAEVRPSEPATPSNGSRATNQRVNAVVALDRTIESALAERLGSPVKIERAGKGGRVCVQFYSDDDLERVLELLGIEL